MNDGYLLADCVIDCFVEIGFIHSNDWKHNTKELYYTVSFFITGTRASIISMEVSVSDNIHKITKSAIRTIERRFNKDFNKVFTECSLDVEPDKIN
jgi:hypothetical protein